MTPSKYGQKQKNDCTASSDQNLLQPFDPRVDTACFLFDTFVSNRADVHVGVNFVINF
jgi:hypothetical protein